MALARAQTWTRGSPLSESTFQSGSRADAYLEWRERLAAKQETRRTQPESPPKAAPNPMWDPARLFESGSAPSDSEAAPAATPAADIESRDEAIDLRTEAIDLRTPLAPASSPHQGSGSSSENPASPAQPRRRALVAGFQKSQPRSVPASGPSTADALRQLNEQRVNGQISEQEFKARKAELFS